MLALVDPPGLGSGDKRRARFEVEMAMQRSHLARYLKPLALVANTVESFFSRSEDPDRRANDQVVSVSEYKKTFNSNNTNHSFPSTSIQCGFFRQTVNDEP